MVSIKRIASDHGNIVLILLPYFCLIIACKTIAQRFILKDGERCSRTYSLHSAGHGFYLSVLLHQMAGQRQSFCHWWLGDSETLPSIRGLSSTSWYIQYQTTSGRPYKSTGEGAWGFHCRLWLITDIFYHHASYHLALYLCRELLCHWLYTTSEMVVASMHTDIEPVVTRVLRWSYRRGNGAYWYVLSHIYLCPIHSKEVASYMNKERDL